MRMKQWIKSPATLLGAAAAIAYPLVVHLGLIQSDVLPIVLVAMLIFFAVMIRQRLTALILILMLLVTGGIYLEGTMLDFYTLPPIAINFFIGMIFLKTLGKNATPLIERYIVLLEGSIDMSERNYARWVTILWAGVLLSLAVESLLLGVFFSHETWSIFTNIINYFILGLMFVGEYLFRLKRFPQKQHMSFVQFIRRLSKVKLKTVIM